MDLFVSRHSHQLTAYMTWKADSFCKGVDAMQQPWRTFRPYAFPPFSLIGHGFNWVVFENDLKWDGWEQEWFVTHDELVNAVNWLHDRNVKIRGHNLVWPGWQYLPGDLQPNASNPSYIWNRIEGRLNEILNYPGLEGVREWDALNEIVVNTSLEPVFQNEPGNVTGRELYANIFKRA